jgi:hypothetical protein
MEGVGDGGMLWDTLNRQKYYFEQRKTPQGTGMDRSHCHIQRHRQSKGALVIVGCTFLAFLQDLKSLPHTDFVVEALYVSWYLMQDSIRSEMTK